MYNAFSSMERHDLHFNECDHRCVIVTYIIIDVSCLQLCHPSFDSQGIDAIIVMCTPCKFNGIALIKVIVRSKVIFFVGQRMSMINLLNCLGNKEHVIKIEF